MQKVSLRAAYVADKSALESLQWRASLSNSGDREALLANPQVIEVPLNQIEEGVVFVAEEGSIIRGFAAIISREEGNAELDALFVDPDAWRLGIGRSLVEHCCLAAKSNGAATLHVVGNPHAEGFYTSCGFTFLSTVQMQFGLGLLMKRDLL